jgi:hypothetical protein
MAVEISPTISPSYKLPTPNQILAIRNIPISHTIINTQTNQHYNYKTGKDFCQLESMIKKLNNADHTQHTERKWIAIVCNNISSMRDKSKDNKISLILSKT